MVMEPEALAAVLLAGFSVWLWLGTPGAVPCSPWNTAPEPQPGRLPGIRTAAAGRDPARSRRPQRIDPAGDTEEYATFIRQLAALLRAGTGPGAAFGLLAGVWAGGTSRAAVDVHAGTSRAVAQLRTGGSLQWGLAAHAAGCTAHLGNARLWQRLAWSLAISQESGAALADLLDSLAEDAEAAADMHRALQAALAGPRATSRLLTYLPGIGLGLGQLLGINPVFVLTGHPVGRIALVVGICLWWGNRFWCARMLKAISNQVPS